MQSDAVIAAQRVHGHAPVWEAALLGSADKVAVQKPARMMACSSPSSSEFMLINEAAVMQGFIPDGDDGCPRCQIMLRP